MTVPPIRCGGGVIEFGRRTMIMGIINMAPDSFAGDGLAGDAEAAEARGREMGAAGADLLDVGGRSTRPRASPVDVEEELRRTIPAVRRLAGIGLPVSVDTTYSRVAAAALDAGAVMVNDVSGLRADPGMAPLVSRTGVPVVVMDWEDRYLARDVLHDTATFLRERIRAATAAGIAETQIVVDPGYGFGLTLAQDFEILRRLRELRALGRPVLIGTSRKGSIGRVLNLPVHDRLEGTAATVAVAIVNGADMVRAHDVRAISRVARMTDAIVRGLAERVADTT
ncbi:MAG: dihydropteroate synthase [Bacillati bacterium ANGP1]|uniref:dihydropteroate synthase n=1 Tax=Candidatus Segetimicrobium genomatis TaxID=2569760 RepID=A0A537LX73_9BACT|nr:MAG: dihydropteroate synthase [Terrabacteria group bacterium ANGP1]